MIVVGGGAAGFFCAISIAELNSSTKVTLLEAGKKTLRKVKISGGGRCNLTHHCFEPKLLTSHYPRGQRELLGPFFQWQPKDMIQWFTERGIATKREADGRVFPVSNSSRSIIDCFEKEVRKKDIQVLRNSMVTNIQCIKNTNSWLVETEGGATHEGDQLCIATGTLKNSRISSCLEKLGHTLSPPIPSLFAFNVSSHPLSGLSGLSLQDAEVTIPSLSISQMGPVLITHKGISGPAVIKLSSWAAKKLFFKDYRFEVLINWLGSNGGMEGRMVLKNVRKEHPRSIIGNCPYPLIPKRLWVKLLEQQSIAKDITWAHLSKEQEKSIYEYLTAFRLPVDGKSTNKEEFVTCGGVSLTDVNFKTLESKKAKGLFFAGECLDIDGVTGGFNFQSAWTTARIAATRIAK